MICRNAHFINLFLLFYVISLTFSHTSLQASDLLDSKICQLNLRDNADAWLDLRTELFRLSLNIKGQVAALEMSADEIDPVGELIGSGMRSDVFLIKDKNGKKFVIKAYHRMDIDKLEQAILIHKTLGKLGIAPKIQGILSTQEMQKLRNKSKLLKKSYPKNAFLQTGIIMEDLGATWNSKEEFPKNHLDPKTKDLIIDQIQSIGKKLGRLRIAPYDLQFLIQRDGSVYVADFDDYFLLKSDEESLLYPPDKTAKPSYEFVDLSVFVDLAIKKMLSNLPL